MDFLPANRRDLEKRGWDCGDFIFVSGDAWQPVMLVDFCATGNAKIPIIGAA
ncbi:MAG: hypothetical protein LBP71_01630 [Spirochaetaceae bacterium]|nr:hypothetical protein [Spirochaetaceae bacterium]